MERPCSYPCAHGRARSGKTSRWPGTGSRTDGERRRFTGVIIPVVRAYQPNDRTKNMTRAEITAAVEELKPRFFEGLTPTELKAVLAGARVQEYPAHSIVS